jgi:hypothetical protein
MTENNFDPHTGEPLNNDTDSAQATPDPQVRQETSPPPQFNPNPAPMPTPQYGQPNPYQAVPPEIRKWNWGAFMFNIIWGIGNKAYMSLLCLIPCFNFIWIFFCGAKGNEWAWKSGEFKDVEQFMAVQRTWNRAGFVYFIIWLCVIVLYLILLIIGVSLFASLGNNLSGYGYNF